MHPRFCQARCHALVALVALLTIPVRGSTTLVVGELFPEIIATDQNGDVFQLSDHRGTIVLLHFCTMWCEACVASADGEADLVADLNERIGAGNWRLVDVLVQDQLSQQTDEVDADNWILGTGTPALTLHSGGTSLLEDVADAIGLSAFPTYFVLNAEGKVVSIMQEWPGNEAISDLVAEVWESAVDTQPPAIAGKRDVIVETKLAPVRVQFTYPTALDAVDGPVPVLCQPRTGSFFAFGRTSVNCGASDEAGNTSASSFGIVVRLPTTAGAVTTPGNLDKPLTVVDPGQQVRITAGGFAPGTIVQVSFTAADEGVADLDRTTAGPAGRMDVRVSVPSRIPGGASQFTAAGVDVDGAEFVRGWLVTVKKGPHR